MYPANFSCIVNVIITLPQIVIVFQCTHILYRNIFWSCEIISVITCIIPCRNNFCSTFKVDKKHLAESNTAIVNDDKFEMK